MTIVMHCKDVFTEVVKQFMIEPHQSRGLYGGFRDTGYLPFYFQGYRLLSIFSQEFGISCSIFCYIQGYWIFWKINYVDICQFIRNTCMFTSKGYGIFGSPLYKPQSTFFRNHDDDGHYTCGVNGEPVCHEHYYGDQCKLYCKGEDSDNGHYFCDENGSKVCLVGE